MDLYCYCNHRSCSFTKVVLHQLISINIENFLSSSWNRFIQIFYNLFPKIEFSNKNLFQTSFNLLFTLIFLIAAFVVVDWIWGFLQYNVGRVFETWDAVVSWNRWATDWAQNMFPRSTQDYPQLIPTSWAMIYRMIGTTQVQFFGKSIMPVFPLFTILLILSIGFITKNYGFFISVIIIRYLNKKLVGEFLIAGYVDLALTFFTLISIIMLWFLHNEQDKEKKKQFYLIAIFFSSGAAVTKQPGLFVLFIILFLGYFMVFGLPSAKIIKQNLKTYLFIVLIILIVVMPWYGLKIIEFIRGIDSSHLLFPINDTQQSHNSTNLLDLLISGLLSLGNPFYILLLVIPSIIVISKFWRWIGLLIVIPYSIIWATYASYDTRNFTLLLPLIAIIVGLGIKVLFDTILMITHKIGIPKIPVISIPIIIIFLMIPLLLIFPKDKLIANQIEKQKQIFSPSIKFSTI